LLDEVSIHMDILVLVRMLLRLVPTRQLGQHLGGLQAIPSRVSDRRARAAWITSARIPMMEA
jgi:hypothetical protein